MEENRNTINWFPGHMAKTRRLISENLKMCDVACEVVDARIPNASRNPVLDELLGDKPRITVLNKSDLADPNLTAAWLSALKKEGKYAVAVDCRGKKGVQDFVRTAHAAGAEILARRAEKGIASKRLRIMITGIPNVGKSSFINMLAGRKAAAAQDRPGVTRGKQWVSVSGAQELDLLDTPGILWPKIDTEEQALLLCYTGAIKDEVLDTEYIAQNLSAAIAKTAPQALIDRYKISEFEGLEGHEILEKIGRARGFVRKGAVVDTERAGHILLDEYRAGKLGRISFEVANG
jgi:ribosome biogenesis GTPase A